MLFARIIPPNTDRETWCALHDARLLETTGSPLDDVVGSPFTGRSYDPGEVTFLPPCHPRQMIIVGWNYAEHTRETDASLPAMPMSFPLSPTGIIAHGADVIIPDGVTHVEHEAELVVIMGKTCRNVSREDALSYVLGVSCGNDVSARDIQNHPTSPNLPRAKAIDTFKPLGPYLVTGIDFSDLPITMMVNGEIRQSARTSDMIFSVPELISFISATLTLHPWDVIYTGTPKGCSPVYPGDTMTVSIEGVGTLTNKVVGRRV